MEPRVNKKCHHKRVAYLCKECPGKGICEHSKRRHRCKICKGKSICVHGKIKYLCKKCKGKGICIHGVNKKEWSRRITPLSERLTYHKNNIPGKELIIEYLFY